MTEPWIPITDKPFEAASFLHGDAWRHTKATPDTVQRSIAISLKRIADMIEEDRKPHLELIPEGFESEGDKRHREWKERMDRAHETDVRNAVALEAIADLLAFASGTRLRENAKRSRPKARGPVANGETPKA